MTLIEKKLNRRSFLKVSALAGGGMMLSFSWLAGCKPTNEEILTMPDEWFEINSYIKIGENGAVTLFNPNPEFGQNVKTSLPMILAEELDIDWKKVFVEQADFYPDRFDRQFTGGSNSVRSSWKPLRTAGATARQLIINAASQTWNVPVEEITTSMGTVEHKSSGKKAGYGEMASLAGTLDAPDPETVNLKEIPDFKIIGKSKKNVDGNKIVTGKPLFALDHKVEGMKYASIVHPPAFGMKLKSFDKNSVTSLPGIQDAFELKIFKDDYGRNFFDTTTFPVIIAIVGNSTWEVLQAKKSLKVEWEKASDSTFPMAGRGGQNREIKVLGGLENSSTHKEKMAEYISKPGNIHRKDGDPETAFKQASRIIERTYSAPFLAHNTMEPMNAFADVKDDQAIIYAPTQAPELIRQTLSSSLGLPVENIQINLARMGGGFGRRAYSHHLTEAALISQKIKAPVKMVYTREDDMTAGVYRPTYSATYRAALDANNNLLGLHVKAGGIPESPLHANRFPAGAIDNYLAESWQIDSNITIGAFRAPRSNFIAGAEQSFLDELAEEMGKDPIEFRLELLKRAETNPVGERNDYDPKRYAGVLELVREKSNWSNVPSGIARGVSAYFCHNSYVAEVVDISIKNKQPVVESVFAAVDCGIVINPDAAANMGEGAIVDGIGNAFFGEMTFEDGVPTKSNFDKYRMIRHNEAPKKIEVHFVENNEAPTGLGEPLFPPIFAALGNSLYKATGKRLYEQPFQPQILQIENLNM
ncbi:xanthine dehydrogenase family protein molybdopterin-binding subunit [Echinicola vietnamensis]|uniref:Aerobic-type carbon monoxide dehydrogenase, large subunit CoxL/CutL-like protein n=1 Tax=Echinicola vietnamensis (strain DSM 17526 / LMG 23754 / KMM 6221) TaxID=926556 RepID=L0G685_ECHVK|nr:molybdopterin cofactor-binding domain-containing protein [Echinicola vietnamensis]AGA80365.1 aerobic-type carbon monoxide dehydrogenase, large subunit CoxL/CutL-like protein [Echinicola vietnamensis DSM 17526]